MPEAYLPTNPFRDVRAQYLDETKKKGLVREKGFFFRAGFFIRWISAKSNGFLISWNTHPRE